jgi:hypothetical protein
MAHQFADGEDSLQLRRVAVNKLNKQPQTADKECSSSLEAGCGSNNLLSGSSDPTGYLWQVISFWKQRSKMIKSAY